MIALRCPIPAPDVTSTNHTFAPVALNAPAVHGLAAASVSVVVVTAPTVLVYVAAPVRSYAGDPNTKLLLTPPDSSMYVLFASRKNDPLIVHCAVQFCAVVVPCSK